MTQFPLEPGVRGDRHGPASSRRPWRTGCQLLFVRYALWEYLQRDARHPLARHLVRQLRQGRLLPVLPSSLAFFCLLLLAVAYTYLLVGDGIIWTLPLWLMLFSTWYCALWIARIVALVWRQSRNRVLDEVSVIPPGRVFLYLTICRVALNRDDALFWLNQIRRILAGIVLLSLALSLCIALTQVAAVEAATLAALLMDLGLIILLIPMEHAQSIVIASLLAIELTCRMQGSIDKTSAVLSAFIVLQILSYALAVAAALALDLYSLSLVLFLFLLGREWLISFLWQLLLRRSNAPLSRASAEGWREVMRASLH